MTHYASSTRQAIRATIGSADVEPYSMIDSWLFGFDLAFTNRLAEDGFIGLTWPKEGGGRGLSNAERQIVTEELLRVGAPVAAHWIADRQIGPALLRHATASLRDALIPGIRSGRITFCLGMSETESGSDLAAVRTRLTEVEGGFRMNGSKIWTSHAHRATHIYVLARLGTVEDKHEGLVELVLDMSSAGVEVRPIHDMRGEHHFNEVVFTDVFVPAENVIGEPGNGWKQVTEQLSFERGGMERVLSTYPLLAVLLRDHQVPPSGAAGLGVLVARLHGLRALARTVAEEMDVGRAPVSASAMLKYLGTTFEGDVVAFAQDFVGIPDPDGPPAARLLAQALVRSPGATIRGGTTEVLLSILSRAEPATPPNAELRGLVREVLTGWVPAADPLGDFRGRWQEVGALGWSSIAVPAEHGGSDGTLEDLAAVVAEVAAAGWSLPLADNVVAHRALGERGRPLDPALLVVSALGPGVVARVEGDELVVNGRQPRVRWGRAADRLLVQTRVEDRDVLLEVTADAPGLRWEEGLDLAREPRDVLVLDDVRVSATAQVGGGDTISRVRGELLVLSAAALSGAARGACELAVEHARARTQFGRSLDRFQAVGHLLARMKADVILSEVAVVDALRECDRGTAAWRTVAAALVAGRSAAAVAKAAHQVLGAMGTTQEHGLHRRSLRVWAWRDDVATQRALAVALGETVLAAGIDPLWDWLVHERDDLGGAASFAAEAVK